MNVVRGIFLALVFNLVSAALTNKFNNDLVNGVCFARAVDNLRSFAFYSINPITLQYLNGGDLINNYLRRSFNPSFWTTCPHTLQMFADLNLTHSLRH